MSPMKHQTMLFINVLLLVIFIKNSLSISSDSELAESKAEEYLQRFGYMEKNNQAQKLLTKEEYARIVAESLRKFQRFAGITESGKLDEETKETMALPRCGVSDEEPLSEARRKKRYALQGSKWRSPEMTFRITKYPKGNSFKKKLSKGVVDLEMKRALEVWSKYTPLKFKKVSSGRVQLDVSFHKKNHGDNDAFDGYGGTLAHAYFPQYGGDVHFDDDEFWTANTYSGTNLFQVAAHEFGHSLGLSHSNVKSSLMAPFYRGYQKIFKLHKDDILAIQSLYGKKVEKKKPELETPDYNPDKEDDIDNTVGQAGGDAPDLCQNPTIDAVVKTKNDFSYVFKGDYYWRILDDGLADGYPRKISVDWDGLPGNIDAAFTWKDGRTFFFKDNKYWRFVNKRMHPGYPKFIQKGFEGIPDNVDAAMVHSKNGKTYFFKGKYYWKFESTATIPVDPKYPRAISEWKGLPDNINAAFEWKNNKDYFFKGRSYYRLKKGTFKVDDNYPRTTSIWWFSCKADSESNSKRNAGLQMLPSFNSEKDEKDDFEIQLRLDGDNQRVDETNSRKLTNSRKFTNPNDIDFDIMAALDRSDTPVVQENEEVTQETEESNLSRSNYCEISVLIVTLVAWMLLR